MLCFSFAEGLAMGESPKAGCFAWLMDGTGCSEVGVRSSLQDQEVMVRVGRAPNLQPSCWFGREAGMQKYVDGGIGVGG